MSREQNRHSGSGGRSKKLLSRPERRFWLFLARTVFHCSVREAQQRIDSAEFAEWVAAYEIEPWGEDWRQTAVLQSTLINVNCKKKVRIEDCMPGRVARRTRSVEEMQQSVMLASKQALMKQRKEAERGNKRQ